MDENYRHYLVNKIWQRSKAGAGGCRVWQGFKNAGGYGVMRFTPVATESITTSAHRVLYMAINNVILPSDIFVCHICDNPSCVNIDHLFAGDAKDNSNDMITKGRRAKKYKLHTRTRSIDNDTISLIKKAKGSLREIADKFGVSMSYVSKLRNGKAKTLL